MPFLQEIEYTEPVGSDTASVGPDDIEISRMFDVEWDERWRFIGIMLGGTQRINGILQNFNPQRYPGKAIVARKASYTGLGVPGISSGAITYPKARITILYSWPIVNFGYSIDGRNCTRFYFQHASDKQYNI